MATAGFRRDLISSFSRFSRNKDLLLGNCRLLTTGTKPKAGIFSGFSKSEKTFKPEEIHDVVEDYEGEIFKFKSDVIQPEVKEYTIEEVDRIRNKSKLRSNHYRKLHGEVPHKDPQLWIHETVRYKRRMFGLFGEASGVNPGLMWPTHQDLDDRLEYEKVAHPFTLPEMIDQVKAKRQAEREYHERRTRELEENMAKLVQIKKDFLNKQKAKDKEVQSAKAKREALLEEVRRHFGYTVDARDERFQQLLAQKEKAERKAKKEAKKLERQKLVMQRMTEGIIKEDKPQAKIQLAKPDEEDEEDRK